MLDELTQEVIKRIEASEGRKRSRTANEQLRFEHAVHVLVTDLWKAVKSTPIRECRINKRSGWYSENPRYRDPLLTYKQMIAVFEGLLRIGFIEVTREGYFDRVIYHGKTTRFVARDELLERLQELDGHPAISIKPDMDAETIILRNKVDGRKVLQEYEDTPATERHRAVRRQGFWNQWRLKLRECLAHLVGFIMRRPGCLAQPAQATLARGLE
tara:strand:- start:11 stop:652 length:642 start_codon:yes stop_codon:yes gene_type:complete